MAKDQIRGLKSQGGAVLEFHVDNGLQEGLLDSNELPGLGQLQIKVNEISPEVAAKIKA